MNTLLFRFTHYQTVAGNKGVLRSISVNFANRCTIFAEELPSLFLGSSERNAGWLVRLDWCDETWRRRGGEERGVIVSYQSGLV